MKKRNLSNTINILKKKNRAPSSKMKPSKLINSSYGPTILNNIFQYSNKENIINNKTINQNHDYSHKNNKNINNQSHNKISKMNKTYNRDNNELYNNYYYKYNINKNKSYEKSINFIDFKNKKENSFNSGQNEKYENENKFNKRDNNVNNNNSYNKYINIEDGEIQLFQKKNQTSTLNNFHNKEKIKSRQRHKQKFINNEYYTSNKIINHFLLNNTNNFKDIKLGLNHNNPIRVNYNMNINQEVNDKNKIAKKNSYDYKNKLQKKINNIKKEIGFEGNNDKFIEYLKLINLKSDITNLVKNIFNNDEKSNEAKIKKCFYKLENLKSKNNENENLLNIYKYLSEQLLKMKNK